LIRIFLPIKPIIMTALFALIAALISLPSNAAAGIDDAYAVYIPPHKITDRTFDEIVHYAALTPINAVVLHVKTPKGKLMWPSENQLAIQLGVAASHSGLARHVRRLKKDNIRTIAKLDVFSDHQLADRHPGMSVIDAGTAMPWSDANGLHWSNPGDSRVWAYNISLAKELARMGFDEIQFDYVRFPSDGDLSTIYYPNTTPGFSKSDRIQGFLMHAHDELKPLGVSISADIFGLTAWKTDDFGVGQVLEKMAPYLDVICPMLYPSHFPAGFLGKQSPGEFPEMIMQTSMRSMMRRTDKPIRPWIQGFWYRPDQIAAQIQGIENALCTSWSVWSPTGRYGLSYQAMASRSGTPLTLPKFYPTVAELGNESDRSVHGNKVVVNYTNFKSGYSILSLEASNNGRRSRYSSPAAILSTLEEGIMDHILSTRGISFTANAEPYTKRKLLSDLLCSDIGKNPRRMRPQPIYIDWAQDCTFSTRGIPKKRLDRFSQAGRHMAVDDTARVASSAALNLAAISDGSLGAGFVPFRQTQEAIFPR